MIFIIVLFIAIIYLWAFNAHPTPAPIYITPRHHKKTVTWREPLAEYKWIPHRLDD